MNATAEARTESHAESHARNIRVTLAALTGDQPQVRAGFRKVTQDRQESHAESHVDLQARDFRTFPQVKKSRGKSRRKSRAPLYVVEGA